MALGRDTFEMVVHVSNRSLGFCCFAGVDAQGHSSAASFRGIAFARHIALRLCDLARANKLITAETLTTIFGAGKGEAFSTTISYTLGVGDLMVANVCKLDASEDTIAGVLVAAIIFPAIDI